ncbi:M23 family metallopeptidase [Chitinispirillales bacterium ANBcel5]|uniref:peptidoglycan DD-metalloendopeptidase family protein n=1 Tax=Cellulosispirillum alkaliphilum TaxID=3039283 RepID=UPI002A56C120|nr:M23 family metallopeptidase [Chitinispirillales bacterium ANBcel5]
MIKKRRYRLQRKKKVGNILKVFTLFIPVILAITVIRLNSSPSLASNTADQELSEITEYLDSLNREIDLVKKDLAYLRYVRRGEIGPGQGMFQVLDDMGISTVMSLAIVNTLTDTVEIVNHRVAEKFEALMDSTEPERVVSFSYKPNPSVEHRLKDDGSGEFVYQRIDHPTTIEHRIYEGVLEQGASLDQTLRAMEIPGSMVGVVNGILQCKISFRTDARAGDRFKVLLRERFFQDSIRIESHVLYAHYNGVRAGTHEAYRYEDFDPKSSYTAHYTREGEALIYSGLRYPLDRLHITSPYGMRRHPITGVRSMHWGVDYRAATGTPVYAVAEGVVVKSAYNRTNGNYIAVRHSDNYTSYYLHLHRRSVRRGQRVQSRQVIGTVGSTGLSTGPHLHFGFKRPNGSWMDPLKKRMIATPKLEGERLVRLNDQIAEIDTFLDSLSTEQPSILAQKKEN